jgi:Flp pilus assembly pilin Flp
MTRLPSVFEHMVRDRTGGPLVEYAMVTALFGLICLIGFNALSTSASGQYNQSTSGMMSIQESPLPTQAP